LKRREPTFSKSTLVDAHVQNARKADFWKGMKAVWRNALGNVAKGAFTTRILRVEKT
jgi:hypothetical protein